VLGECLGYQSERYQGPSIDKKPALKLNDELLHCRSIPFGQLQNSLSRTSDIHHALTAIQKPLVYTGVSSFVGLKAISPASHFSLNPT